MPKFKLNVAGLAEAMKKASLALRKPREERQFMIRELVGSHYSEMGATFDVPVNMVSLYTSIVGPSLIANNPRVMLSTFDKASKDTVRTEELWINQQIERQRLSVALRRTVLNGLFQVGIGVVALATKEDASRYSWLLKEGEPYYADVSPDDFLYDVHARDFDEVGWIGWRMRVPTDLVRENKDYSSVRKDAIGQPDPIYNAEGDERASTISRGYYSDGTEFEDMSTVWVVYVPRHRVVIKLLGDDAGGVDVKTKPLEEKEWIGPDKGPILTLSFGTVPDNAMPIAPLSNVIDLHLAINKCYRKLIWQATNLKNLTFYPQAQGEVSDRIMNAVSGSLVPVLDPKGIVAVTMNSPDQQLFAMAEALKNLYDFMGNNLSLQGGLAPESKTATQDELLNKNASTVAGDRQNAVKDYVSDVCDRLMWYHHHHPTNTMHAHEAVPGVEGMGIPRTATPERRAAVPYESIQKRIDPYSLTHKTPQQRLQDMQGVVTSVVLPMMQLLIQQGVQFDINAYLKRIGEWMAEPDLADILTLAEPPQGMQQGPPGGEGPSMGPPQTRTYERVSRPGTTPQGDSRDRINKMMAGSPGGAPSQNGQLRAQGTGR